MHQKFRKLWPLALTSLLAFTSIVEAATDNAQMRNMENRITALEQRRGANGMLNPPARPQVKDGADLFVTLDLLVWQARETGLALGIMSQTPDTDVIAGGKVSNFTFEWNPGFRLGVGYNMGHDSWDLNLTWLRFNTTGHRKAHAHSNQVFYPRLQHPADPVANDNTFSKVKGHWRMELNQLDLDLGREFYVSKWLTLRPHFGLRSDWIHQKLTAKYDHDAFFIPAQDTHVKDKDHWWGIGLEGGLDTQWGLGGGWSIYANICAAIIYGFHHLSYTDNDPQGALITPGTDFEFVEFEEQLSRFSPYSRSPIRIALG